MPGNERQIPANDWFTRGRSHVLAVEHNAPDPPRENDAPDLPRKV